VAQLWLARWLAEAAEVGDLRQRADGGDYHAQQELPGCLAESGHLDELRQRAEGGDDHALQVLAGWLADHRPLDELRELITAKEGRLAQLRRTWQSWQGDMDVISVLADLGDDRARRQLAHHGSREELRQRAAAGDEYARERLAELPGE
jgi:hypothetical protein